ncbi:MAG: peptide ABC transporter substrate-binding protein [Chloroflexi bacterium]|nr:peptide ABC transporter substrate-binding protein [Chloroflexota bacterium]
MKGLLPLLMILALAAVACGPPASTATPEILPSATAEPVLSASATPTATPEAAGEAPISSQVPQGGTLLRLWVDPPTLDPHLTGDVTSAVIIVEVFGGLVTIEPQNPSNIDDQQLEIVGDLAERWEISDGGRTYTFHLRKNAKFHNGKSVTAQDIKWSLERATDPATQAPTVDIFLGDILGVPAKLEGLATEISGVRVIDDFTLSITADATKPYFLAKLTYPTAFVLDRENVEGNRNWFLDPNGTGPFRLAEYSPGELIRLERNEFYHLGPPNLDEVQFILSGGSAMLMYENDEIHVTGIALAQLDAVRDPSNPLSKDVRTAPPAFEISYMGMNSNVPPFDDRNVRQALNYAIDKELIARVVLQNLSIPAQGILPPGFPGYNPEIQGYEFDPAKAMQLLRDSKYGANLEDMPRITLTLPGSFGATVSPSYDAILRMWEENLGIEVSLVQTEWATFLQDLRGLRFQMFGGLAWIADYPDPENFLDVLFHSESSDNHMGYSNPDLDRILEQARTELDQEARFNLYHLAEETILRDAPWIPLWHGNEGYILVKPNVKNYYLLPLVVPKLRFVYLTDA